MAFMRHNNNGRRHNNNFNRNRNGGNGSQHQNQGQNQGQRRVNRANHVFESNGPEGRVRGTAQQIVEKYTTMARDANVSGDKVLSMNYLQHAEHYQRLWNEIMEETSAIEREREAQRAQQQAAQAEGQPSDNVEGSATGDQPQQQQNRPPREQREPREHRQPQPRHDDENALPNFLHVPITTASESGSSEAAPQGRPQRPRRPNPGLAAEKAE